MTFKEFKKRKIVKFISNVYVIIGIAFTIWMLFIDENSYLIHLEFDKEIDELETSVEFYKNKIKEDKKIIKILQDSGELERFAREHYLMKKENEDIYIMEFDTIKE